MSLSDTIFSENKALFRAIHKDSVEKLDEEVIEGKQTSQYTVELGIPDYINIISQDKDVLEREKKDIKEILASATIKINFWVEKKTDYIIRLKIDAKRLAIVKTPESEQLGLSAVYDNELTSDLSRFNLPVDVTAPPEADVILAPRTD